MNDFLKSYGCTKGPLGVPCTDEQAFELDRICRSIREPEVKRMTLTAQPEFIRTNDGEGRNDEAWISTEDTDHIGDLVLARGMDASHFTKNPVVPLNHAYWLPPVGRCKRLWEARSETARGVKALTVYPPRPEAHQGEWGPDDAWGLVKSGLLNGRSIGFVPTAKRDPTDAERKRGVRRVIEKWLLLEYSLTGMPVNPFAVTSGVSKSVMQALGYDVSAPKSWDIRDPDEPPPRVAAFTTLSEIERSLKSSLDFDVRNLVAEAAASAVAKRKGTV